MPEDHLKAYSKKRDFSQTPEPSDDLPEHGTADGPVFVVQKHDASRLHYDFRLEVDGVLKSWAVPKGPSINPSEKRLAMPTEDHPMGYAIFEGVIPKGQYGAGPVIVWDLGTFRNITEKHGEPVPAARAIEDGHISLYLAGQKLQGGFSLIQMKHSKDKGWLLVKMDDDGADPTRDIVAEEPRSVLSGRTIEEVRAEKE